MSSENKKNDDSLMKLNNLEKRVGDFERSENKLKEEKEYLESLISNSLDCIVQSDAKGIITSVNQAFIDLTGFEKENILGKTPNFLSPVRQGEYESVTGEKVMFDDKFFNRQNDQMVVFFKSGRLDNLKTAILRKDGKVVPVEENIFQIYGKKGETVGNAAIIRDITASKKIEEELKRHRDNLDELVKERTQELRKRELQLRESRDFLENIFTTTRDGIIITDVTGAVIRVNNSVERIFGFKKDEMIGRYMTEFIPKGEKYKVVGRGFSDELKEKGFLDIFEAFFMKKNGEITPFECNITVLSDEKGQATGAVVMLRDITGRKKMEQQFLRTEKLSSLGELAGGVAHDFNNMLSAILGRTQLLMMRISKGEKDKDIEKLLEDITESLKVIEKASLDGADTVHRIMKFARKEKKGESILININDVINDAIEFTRPRWKVQAQTKGISFIIKKDFCCSCSYVFGVASELREVITNILINAFDAMPGGGEVFIQSYAEAGFFVAEISDTGTGIEQEVLDKIFDPFFTTKGPKSTGLGMSVSYGIIEQHGGTISVKSFKNEKTIFTIRLPLSERHVVKMKKAPAVLKQKKINILIIEDEKAVSEMFEEMLVNEGHKVDVACDGSQGIDIFREKKFDLVFTDLAMPGISGWQVAKEIKKMDPEVPVILTTGYEVKSSGEEADKKNVDIIIKKPFTVSRIIEVIVEVLKKRQDL